jgi:N-acetyl-1-D-myo-inositol-2-amino-2-deoxy-alpha-D-glucopyranoside deacetylase
MTELAAACAALGVPDHRFLGGAGRYRDSGMMGLPTNDHPRAFWQADLDEAAGYLVEIMREVRPQVLVTYDMNGFYGHPDHIQAHRVAMRAAELAAAEGFGPAKIYWTAMPKSVLEAGMTAFAGSSDNPFAGIEQLDDLPFGSPDEEIAARIESTDQHAAKEAAMRAHATQIPDTSWLYSIASNFGGGFMGVEYYTLAAGAKGPGIGPYGWEDDLFAGLALDGARATAVDAPKAGTSVEPAGTSAEPVGASAEAGAR